MTKTNDVLLSEDRWEKIYKSHRLKSFTKDPTIISYKRFLDNYRSDFKKGVFLDLGCGVAYLSALLAKEGVDVLGVDISKEAIEKSKGLFKKNNLKGDFINADLLDLPIKSNSVNFIYSCMGLEYVKNTQKAIDEAFRVLKRDGRIIAIVPVISLTTLTYHQLRGDIPDLPIIKNLMEFIHIRLLKGKYMHYGYEKSFTPKGFKKMLEKAGFKVAKIDYFDMYYPIAFIPKTVRSFFQKILKYRPFWPLIYIEARK